MSKGFKFAGCQNLRMIGPRVCSNLNVIAHTSTGMAEVADFFFGRGELPTLTASNFAAL